jgi:endonuclease G
MRVNVYTSPYFGDGDLEHASGAKILLVFWKVVAIVTEDGRPSVTAYRVSQEQELGELEFVFAGYKMYQISAQQVMNNTRIDFSALAEYDGFSEHERAGGGSVEERLDSLERVRV